MTRLRPDGYETAEQLAGDLGVNARSLRQILREEELVPGHEEADGTPYQMTLKVAERIARHQRVGGLPHHGP
jgi:hypothetical protein